MYSHLVNVNNANNYHPCLDGLLANVNVLKAKYISLSDASPELVCNMRTMLLWVPDNFSISRSLDPSSGHLADPSCTAGQEANGMVWYEAQSQAGVCGNVLRVRTCMSVYHRTGDLMHFEALLKI